MKQIFTTLSLVLMMTGWITAQSCSAPDGLNAQAQNDAMLLTWNAAANATGYRIKIEDADNNPQDFVLEVSTNELQFLATTLQPNAPYKFKVRTNCPGGRSDWSAYFFFTPGNGNNGGGGTGSCDLPTGLVVSNITNDGANLSWTAVPGALQYEVEVEDAENTPAFQFNIVTSETTVSVLGLAPNGNYKFKVKSKCSGGSSLYSDWVFFSTGQIGGGGTGDDNGGSGSCEVPAGLTVAEITDTKALLTWSKVAGAEKYEVEVEDDENTPLFTFHGITADTFIVITGLAPGGNYQFKVKSECGGGASSVYSDWVFFTTGSVGNPGGDDNGGNGGNGTDDNGGATGSCAIPSGLTVVEVTSTTALLSWSSVPGAIRYEAEVEDDEGTPLFSFSVTTNDTSILVPGLAPGGHYQFRVKSKCSGGVSSDFSGWVFFTAQTGLVTPGAGAINTLQSAGNNYQNAFNIFPNPARETINIRTAPNAAMEAYAVRIADARGSLVYRNDQVTTEEININVNTLQNGFYFVTITGSFGTQSQQLVVAH